MPNEILFLPDEEEEASDHDSFVDAFSDMQDIQEGKTYAGHTVHFWTIAHSDKPGAVTAATATRKQLMRHFKAVYGDAILWYGCFKEVHKSSLRLWEKREHYHVVLKLCRRVRWKLLAAQLRSRKIFGHLSLPRRHADVWRILSYVYCPSLRKGVEELDDDPLFSSSFPMDQLEKKFKQRMFGLTQLRPAEFYSALTKLVHLPETYADLVCWAAQQEKRGNGAYSNFLVRQGAKAPGLFQAWRHLLAGRMPTEAVNGRAQRLHLWRLALESPCACTSPRRLRDALEYILQLQGKSADRFGFAISRLLRLGTAVKNSNVLLFGESNAGKTCLTRPLICIYGATAFLRPSKGDTFPLQNLERKIICFSGLAHGVFADRIRHFAALLGGRISACCSQGRGVGNVPLTAAFRDYHAEKASSDDPWAAWAA